LQAFPYAGHAEQIEPLVRAVENHKDDLIFVLLGFDGVLVEYDDNPDAVRLSAAQRTLLRHLLDAPGIALGVMSGRRLRDLRRRIGLGDDVFYFGLHGLEAAGPRFRRIERQAFAEHRNVLRDISAAAQPLISQIDGAHLEDKEAVLALHTRHANSGDAIWARLHLLGQASTMAHRPNFRMLRGHHVLELVPNIGATKAAAISAARDFLERRDGRRVFIVYLGEDVAEDDAHEAITGHGVAATVGPRIAARAAHHVGSVALVDQLLRRVAEACDPGASSGRC
jgi:alpha,alpha-trehalase